MAANLWYVGVILEVLAGISGTAGKQLVSFSARKQGAPIAKVCKIGGLCITTFIGPVFDAAAFAFAAQAIVAPLNGLDVCWNTLFAPFTLGEKLTRAHIAGTALVASGAALTAVFGPHSGDIASLEDVRAKFYRWRVAIYLCVFTALLLLAHAVLRQRPKGVGDKARGLVLGACGGALAGNMYFCTAAVGLLRLSISTGDWEAWTHWQPYVLAVCTVCVALGNIPIISRGLQEYEAIFMVTLFEGCHICVACVSGAIILDEMDGHGAWQMVAYWCCVLMICWGLYILQTAAVHGIGGPASPSSFVRQPGSFALQRAGSTFSRAAASFLELEDSPCVLENSSISMQGVAMPQARAPALSPADLELSQNGRL